MRILLPLIIAALCVYYYLETHKEPPPAPVAVAAPKPTPRKVYYHSPLDAPAMPTNAHTGSGYTSSSRNTNWRGSHLSDGQTTRMAVSDQPAEPEGN